MNIVAVFPFQLETDGRGECLHVAHGEVGGTNVEEWRRFGRVKEFSIDWHEEKLSVKLHEQHFWIIPAYGCFKVKNGCKQ